MTTAAKQTQVATYYDGIPKAGRKRLEWEVIKLCMDLSFQNVAHGSLFVIDVGEKPRDYYTKVFPAISANSERPLSLIRNEDRPVIGHLSTLDSATIIDRKGNMLDFGVTLKRQSTFLGHGKRHAFAYGTSKLGNLICILASEEDKHVRVFRDGVCLADIDSRTMIPATTKHKIVDILDSPISKVLVASGIATSILTLNPIPAIITITGSSIIVSYGFDRIKKLF